MRARVLARTDRMTREEWLAARRHGIGSSDAAAVVGLDPFRSPLRVWLEKTGQTPDETSVHAEVGRELEPFVARKWSERTGMKARRIRAILQHPELPWMIAEPDRAVVGGGLLECKVTMHDREWRDGGVPERYLVQVQHQLAVTGEARAWIAVLILGKGLEIREVERDDRLISELIALEQDWWNRYVVAGQMPPADGSADSARLLEQIYPEAREGKTVLLPYDEASELIKQYRLASKHVEEWERLREEAATRLKALMGDAELGLLGGRPAVRWTTVRTSRLDAKALREAHPDIAQAFTREQTYRRFSLVGEEEVS